ncbi:hypothetical protein AVEN_99531-1 [Araneus ventricosus]|uniref:Uncharacterized protein n=1 Tax=Araneus ventricosus TaxID=182803 RepID=A0A4Y2LLL4_ARAVE|nr:hypothetical protein AVEN_99531-1 [Araneus ventricosus]
MRHLVRKLLQPFFIKYSNPYETGRGNGGVVEILFVLLSPYTLPLVWCGGLEKEVLAQVLSSSSDRSSKLRGLSQNSPSIASKCDISISKLSLVKWSLLSVSSLPTGVVLIF